MNKPRLRALSASLLITAVFLATFASLTFSSTNQPASPNYSLVNPQLEPLIQPLATSSFPFPFETPTPTPTPTPIPTPTPVPTPKPILATPKITFTCKASTTESGGVKVEINGNLESNVSVVPNESILVSCSVNGDLWEDVNLVRTQTDGSFAAVWMPTATGSYFIKASTEETAALYAGNKTVNIALLPDSDDGAQTKNLFTINSNSNLTQATYDPANGALSFSISGDTAGTVDLFMPKSYAADISTLKIYLDGNAVQFEKAAQPDSWLISFACSEGQHSVLVELPDKTQQPLTDSTVDWTFYAVIFVAVLVGVAGLTVLVRHQKEVALKKKYAVKK